MTLGALAAAGTAAVAVVDPNTSGIALCPLLAFTGLDCPFCGSLRAVHALTRFDVGLALDHNAVFTVAVPLLLVGWLVWILRSLRHPGNDRLALPVWSVTATLGVLAVFGVLRNLPDFAWFASGVS